ncbi:MAG: polysaccharide deacetylase family protein [Chthoniobacteraceae bacterium]|nr:polysaccharide deacetylase family protein [Chthoniobacteraceae bacterium]
MIRSFLALAALTALLPLAAEAQYAENTPAAKMEPSTPGIHLSYSSVHPDGPYIALTFDDGPGKTTTPRLLDLLAQRHIKVTFFVLGENAKDNPDIIKRELAEGHEIANHSWDHENLAKKSEEGLRSEIVKTQDAIFQITGTKPKVLRPPYGAITEHQKKWINEQFGLKVVLWEVDPNDWKKPGSSVIARRIVEGTRPGSIILSHDIHAQTVDAMPEVLDGLLAKGFKFVTVSELIAMDHPVAKPSPSPAAASAASAPAASPAPKKKTN